MTVARSEEDIMRQFVNAYECEDGHYFDSDECHYCGFRDGVVAALAFVLGISSLYREVDEARGDRIRSNLTVREAMEAYHIFKDHLEGEKKWTKI